MPSPNTKCPCPSGQGGPAEAPTAPAPARAQGVRPVWERGGWHLCRMTLGTPGGHEQLGRQEENGEAQQCGPDSLFSWPCGPVASQSCPRFSSRGSIRCVPVSLCGEHQDFQKLGLMTQDPQAEASTRGPSRWLSRCLRAASCTHPGVLSSELTENLEELPSVCSDGCMSQGQDQEMAGPPAVRQAVG